MKKLKIIYEDKFLLVVDKPYKKLTVANDKSDDTLYSEIYTYLHKKNQKVFIVHRLDYDTSGLIIFAKNEKVRDLLQQNWKDVVRKYYALVDGNICQKLVLKDKLWEDKTHFVRVSKHSFDDKLAVTEVEPIKNRGTKTLVVIKILTGRKNQIRVQLANNGHPIVGDTKYNGIKANRLMLQAYYLEFKHPVTNNKLILQIDCIL